MAYNGWKNWDTWEAHNFLTGYETPYFYVRELARATDATLKQFEQEAKQFVPSSVNRRKVDWNEIREAFRG